MAKTKKRPRQNPPEPNLFIQSQNVGDSHQYQLVILLHLMNLNQQEPVEPSEQQVAPLASVEKTPAVVIQPAPSGQEESEEREEVAEPELKNLKTDRKRKKKEKKMKNDKKTKRQKLAEQPSEETPSTTKQMLKQLKRSLVNPRPHLLQHLVLQLQNLKLHHMKHTFF